MTPAPLPARARAHPESVPAWLAADMAAHADRITREFLRPAIAAAGGEPDDYALIYDLTPLQAPAAGRQEGTP